MIVYKVVRSKNGKLKSAMTRRNPIRSEIEREYAQLIYKPGKVTKPKFGKIFAFSTLADAKLFIMFAAIPSNEVWEALVSKAEPIYRIGSDGGWGVTVLRRFKAFWRGEEPCGMPAPAGTVVCPELTLMRRCDNEPVKNSP